MTDVPDLDDVAARALASVILEHTADLLAATADVEDNMLDRLAADTGLVLDVCAGILIVTSWLAGAGGLTAEEVFAASIAFLPDDDEILPAEAPEAPEPPHPGSGADGATDSPETLSDDPGGRSGATVDVSTDVSTEEVEAAVAQATAAARKALADD